MFAAAAAALTSRAVAVPALADTFSPESGGSPNADKIDSLYKITGFIGLVILLAVEALIIYAVVKFRRRRGGPEPVAVHGNAPLEIGWTIGARGLGGCVSGVRFLLLAGILVPAVAGA